MNDHTDRQIDELLHALAGEDAKAVVPPRVATVVMEAWDAYRTSGIARRSQRAWHRPVRRWRAALASALVASAVVVAVTRVDRTRVDSPRGVPSAAAGSSAREPEIAAGTGAANVRGTPGQVVRNRPASLPRGSGSEAAETGFVIAPEPLADPTTLHIVRVRMSRVALASLGLPIADPDAEGLLEVEMLVGDDGVARSIRRATFAGGDPGSGGGR